MIGKVSDHGSDPLALSNEVIELVDANGLARDALGRAHSHANPRPRNRPVKNANARLRKYTNFEVQYVDAANQHRVGCINVAGEFSADDTPCFRLNSI